MLQKTVALWISHVSSEDSSFGLPCPWLSMRLAVFIVSPNLWNISRYSAWISIKKGIALTCNSVAFSVLQHRLRTILKRDNLGPIWVLQVRVKAKYTLYIYRMWKYFCPRSLKLRICCCWTQRKAQAVANVSMVIYLDSQRPKPSYLCNLLPSKFHDVFPVLAVKHLSY